MCMDPAAKAEIREIKNRLEKLEKAIDGNGRPGLLERMAALEQSNRTQTWLLRIIIGGVLTNIVGVAFIALKAAAH